MDLEEERKEDNNNDGEDKIDNDEVDDDIDDDIDDVSEPESVHSESDNEDSLVRVFVCNDAGPKPVSPPPTIETKKLKVPTTAVNYKDPQMKKLYEKMKRKAHALHDYIQTNRLEWLQHRSVYNQLLASCYDRFKILFLLAM